MRLFIIRHGERGAETDHADDPALTELGKRQAQLTAAALAGEGIEMLYCSPLTRALQTAAAITGALGLQARVWPEIAETWGAGHDVLARSDVARRWPQVILPAEMPEQWWPAVLPEDEAAHYRRAAGVVGVIRARFEQTEQRVALVGHGTFGGILISSFLGLGPCGYTRFSQANCCVSQLEIALGRAKVLFHNRTCHLPAELLT